MVQNAPEQDRKKEEALLIDSLRMNRGAYMLTKQRIALEDGFVRLGHSGNLALLSLLLTGRRVILDLNGTMFFCREARIRSTGWYTEGHPHHEGESGGAENASDVGSLGG